MSEPETILTSEPPEPIHRALAAVAAEVGPIEKADVNTEQGFVFRGIDRIMERVGPLLHKHGVTTIPRVRAVDHRYTERGKFKNQWEHYVVTVSYTFLGPLGDSIEAVVVGEGLDNADKGISKAMTVAYKTALLQVLGIGSGGADPDALTPDAPSDRTVVHDTGRAPAKKKATAKKATTPAVKARPRTPEEQVAGLVDAFGAEHAASVAMLIEALNKIEPEEARVLAKQDFVAHFGPPSNLVPERLDEALVWLDALTGDGEKAEPDPPPSGDSGGLWDGDLSTCRVCGATADGTGFCREHEPF